MISWVKRIVIKVVSKILRFLLLGELGKKKPKKESKEMIRNGIKTSEFWLTILGIGLGIVKKYILPDLPEEAFYTIIVYILSRAGVKAFSRPK